ncbi:MAG: Uma2 family endonuclease [Planctomycetota bacterium]|nr:Uma2 family endonuclease [Planctomycetota bacterium]
MLVSSLPNAPPYPVDRLVTGAELLAHPEWGRCELVRGKVVPLSPPKPPHGILTAALAIAIGTFVKQRKLGKVLAGDPGLYTTRDPDSVRGPDVCFISNERLQEARKAKGYWEVPPELCVEVVSPGDEWSEVMAKVEEYLAAGVTLVWVVDPQRRKAHVFRSDRPAKALAAANALDGEDVLPGFAVPLAELFAELD